ncbi:hypothetical protein INR49_024003, partial [Caranx melampygus]
NRIKVEESLSSSARNRKSCFYYHKQLDTRVRKKQRLAVETRPLKRAEERRKEEDGSGHYCTQVTHISLYGPTYYPAYFLDLSTSLHQDVGVGDFYPRPEGKGADLP